MVSTGSSDRPTAHPEGGSTMFADVKVPIHLGVMSRCPDAVLCESVFDKVLPRVIGKIDLSLVVHPRAFRTSCTRHSSLDPTNEDFGVKCMHGAQCQNYHGRESVGEPDLALSCAGASKIDWEGSGVGQCAGNDASGKAPEGIAMLKESLRLAQNLNIQCANSVHLSFFYSSASLDSSKSCTVLINKKAVCVHDGTWKDCEGFKSQKGHDVNDFVKQIEEEYEHLNELN
ncbi:secreted protein [Salix suchowensis]|nr:secreted protein [Salix suchowensis]